jgi:hypothetical protein
MPRRPVGSVLDDEIVSFHAEVQRLALALVEQALAAELARFRSSLPLRAELVRDAAELRRTRKRR